jgi:DNA-binding MarR family transcriptional regulator
MPPTSHAPRNLQEEIGKVTAFDCPEQEAFLNLIRTHAGLAGEFAQLFKEFALSEPQYNALRIVAAAGARGIRTEAIGDRMVARDPDTTRLIDRLVKAGLVSRTRSEEDRRCVLVGITDEGRQLLRRLRPRVDRMHRQQLGHLDPRELERLSELLFQARHPSTG